jgi:hypothetical protein
MALQAGFIGPNKTQVEQQNADRLSQGMAAAGQTVIQNQQLTQQRQQYARDYVWQMAVNWGENLGIPATGAFDDPRFRAYAASQISQADPWIGQALGLTPDLAGRTEELAQLGLQYQGARGENQRYERIMMSPDNLTQKEGITTGPGRLPGLEPPAQLINTPTPPADQGGQVVPVPQPAPQPAPAPATGRVPPLTGTTLPAVDGVQPTLVPPRDYGSDMATVPANPRIPGSAAYADMEAKIRALLPSLGFNPDTGEATTPNTEEITRLINGRDPASQQALLRIQKLREIMANPDLAALERTMNTPGFNDRTDADAWATWYAWQQLDPNRPPAASAAQPNTLAPITAAPAAPAGKLPIQGGTLNLGNPNTPPVIPANSPGNPFIIPYQGQTLDTTPGYQSGGSAPLPTPPSGMRPVIGAPGSANPIPSPVPQPMNAQDVQRQLMAAAASRAQTGQYPGAIQPKPYAPTSTVGVGRQPSAVPWEGNPAARQAAIASGQPVPVSPVQADDSAAVARAQVQAQSPRPVTEMQASAMRSLEDPKMQIVLNPAQRQTIANAIASPQGVLALAPAEKRQAENAVATAARAEMPAIIRTLRDPQFRRSVGEDPRSVEMAMQFAQTQDPENPLFNDPRLSHLRTNLFQLDIAERRAAIAQATSAANLNNAQAKAVMQSLETAEVSLMISQFEQMSSVLPEVRAMYASALEPHTQMLESRLAAAEGNSRAAQDARALAWSDYNTAIAADANLKGFVDFFNITLNRAVGASDIIGQTAYQIYRGRTSGMPWERVATPGQETARENVGFNAAAATGGVAAPTAQTPEEYAANVAAAWEKWRSQ